MMDVGIGTMGLKPWEFWELTLADFVRLKESYLNNQYQHWDHTRNILSMLVNTAFGNKKKVNPTDIVKLPIDNIVIESKAHEKPDLETVRKRFENDIKKLKIRPDQVN